MYHDLSKVDGLWGCSEFRVISFIVMNDPTMGLPAQVFVWICVFTALPVSLCGYQNCLALTHIHG